MQLIRKRHPAQSLRPGIDSPSESGDRIESRRVPTATLAEWSRVQSKKPPEDFNIRIDRIRKVSYKERADLL